MHRTLLRTPAPCTLGLMATVLLGACTPDGDPDDPSGDTPPAQTDTADATDTADTAAAPLAPVDRFRIMYNTVGLARYWLQDPLAWSGVGCPAVTDVDEDTRRYDADGCTTSGGATFEGTATVDITQGDMGTWTLDGFRRTLAPDGRYGGFTGTLALMGSRIDFEGDAEMAIFDVPYDFTDGTWSLELRYDEPYEGLTEPHDLHIFSGEVDQAVLGPFSYDEHIWEAAAGGGSLYGWGDFEHEGHTYRIDYDAPEGPGCWPVLYDDTDTFVFCSAPW